VPGLEAGDTVPDMEPLLERLARRLLPLGGEGA